VYSYTRGWLSAPNARHTQSAAHYFYLTFNKAQLLLLEICKVVGEIHRSFRRGGVEM